MFDTFVAPWTGIVKPTLLRIKFGDCFFYRKFFILLFEYLFLPQDDLVAVYDENVGTVSDYAKELYNGVLSNLDKLDETLATYSKKWKLSRLPKVSLTVLRLALYEMAFVNDLPDSIAINEAVELAKKYGSQEDAAFINGVLGAVSRSKAE